MKICSFTPFPRTYLFCETKVIAYPGSFALEIFGPTSKIF